MVRTSFRSVLALVVISVGLMWVVRAIPNAPVALRLASASGELPLDPRESLYVRFGDWFAMLCLGTTLFAVFYGAIVGRAARPIESTAAVV